MTLKRRDTPENRAFWDFVEREAKWVREHNMCFVTFCCVGGDTPCPKAKQPQEQGDRADD